MLTNYRLFPLLLFSLCVLYVQPTHTVILACATGGGLLASCYIYLPSLRYSLSLSCPRGSRWNLYYCICNFFRGREHVTNTRIFAPADGWNELVLFATGVGGCARAQRAKVVAEKRQPPLLSQRGVLNLSIENSCGPG